MPLDPAVISAGAGIVSSGINAYSQYATNQSQQNFALGLYGMQRQAALADWKAQNEYNSPAQQMQRLRDAGLNPNLVYGHGADAMSTSPIRSSSPGSYSPRAPQFDLQSIANNALSFHYDMQIKKQTVDNLKAQHDVMLQDQALKAANTKLAMSGVPLKDADTANRVFDLFMKNQLAPGSLEMQQANIRKANVSSDVALDANERAQAMLAPNLQIAAQKILNMRAERLRIQEQTAKTADERNQIAQSMLVVKQKLKSIIQDQTLKDIDIKLWNENGINRHDPAWFRVLNNFLGTIYDAASGDVIKK